MKRKLTKKIKVGDIYIGGDSPITVQSMTNTQTSDIESTLLQLHQLEEAGCDIIRMSVTTKEDAMAIDKYKQNTKMPIIADIQFDYKIALEAINSGIDGLRINPGNMGNKDKIKEIVNACKKNQLSIRLGVNSGSLSKEFLRKYNGVNEYSMVESAMEQVKILEEIDFNDIKISLKASSVPLTINSYSLISEKVDYPQIGRASCRERV